MRLLVTGAAGFIGANFVRWLLQGPESSKVKKLIAYDLLTYAGNLANLQGLETNPAFSFVKGDIRDNDKLEELIEKEEVDVVINFAAESHVDRSITNPLDFVRTNIEGTLVILNVARKFKVSRFIQISTDEVYGSLGPEGRFSELSPIDPSSPYSASKASADFLVLAAHKTYAQDVCVTRCSNNYGPYQFPEKLIPLFITNALDDKPLPVYGDGKNVRSWLHVDDHSRAIFAVLEKGRAGEIYNIGGAPESEKENLEVTAEILKILGKPSDLMRYVEDRKGHDRRYAVDFSKINKELGWKPQVNFKEGIKSTIDWYCNNSSWWKEIKTGEYMSYYQKQYGSTFC